MYTKQVFAQEETAIKKTVTDLFDGMRKGDTALMRSCFAPGAMLQSVAHNREGKTIVVTEPVDSFLVAVGKPHKEVYDERIAFESVLVNSELASVWTPYKFYVDERFSHCGIDSYQLVKINGRWKIQYLIDTRTKKDCDNLKGFESK